MKKKINHLDLFSGIGGFHLGFERAGYKVTSFFSEIDKHAIAVYKHQFKNSTYVGSVTDLRGSDLPTIDLLTFGSPCQDFSLAGKRKGMEGERSSLILEAIRLIKECRPRVFIWENVKGTFSSNAGEDFAAILQEFAHVGGYRLEWQLLNTSWFLPQNRERIYLVGYSAEPRRDWRGVFPIGEDGSRTASAEVKQIGTRRDSNGGQQPYQQHRVYNANGIVPALNQAKSDLILRVKSATSDGYEQAEIGDSINLSNPNSETRRGRVGKGKAQTLETSCNQAVVQPVQLGQGPKTRAVQGGTVIGDEGRPAFTLRTTNPNGVQVFSLNVFRIRRLTPIECERLQGFPDNHTAFGIYDGEVKPMSKTHRYKQCGNAVTVDVVQAVAERLKPVM